MDSNYVLTLAELQDRVLKKFDRCLERFEACPAPISFFELSAELDVVAAHGLYPQMATPDVDRLQNALALALATGSLQQEQAVACAKQMELCRHLNFHRGEIGNLGQLFWQDMLPNVQPAVACTPTTTAIPRFGGRWAILSQVY